MPLRKRRIFLAGLAIAALAVPLSRPPVDVPAPDPYFDAVSAALSAAGLSRPVVVLDLDRVDHNLAELQKTLGSDAAYRATTKSLPSYELLRYVLTAMRSQRLMEFHGPYLRPLIDNLIDGPALLPGVPPRLDILLGKPLPASEVEAFYAAPPAENKLAATRLRWLVDHEARLAGYLAIAQRRSLTLDIAVEVDVGLHRGGTANLDMLGRLLGTIASHPQHLRFAGLMGYEGHVPYAPPLFRSAAAAQDQAFADSQAALAAAVSFVRTNYAALAGSELLVDAGGSKTFPRYRQGGAWSSRANELALGSAVVKPGDFDVEILAALQPALYIAEPVLKRLSPGPLPHAEGIGKLWSWWNRNRRDVVFVYGGGWDLQPVYPQGLYSNPLYNNRPADNRIPNQSLLNVAADHPLKPGDYVYFRPLQGDILVQFNEIQILRGGKRIGTWRPFDQRL